MDSPLKWHGGKHYLAPRIVALMPPHLHYVEPFAGSLAVLLAKDPEGVSEVVNDVHPWLTAFWRAMQDEAAFARFCRRAEATPFSERAWEDACTALAEHPALPEVDYESAAWAFFVCCRQSLAGRMENFAPLSRTRTRRGMNEQASAWLNAVEGLPAVHARLKRVAVLNRPALAVIRSQDGPGTLFYLDPPYLHETRATTKEYGAYEMAAEAHAQLLHEIQPSKLKGKVMLSGYRSPLYDAALSGWKRHDFELPNNSAGGASKRRMVECVWCNF